MSRDIAFKGITMPESVIAGQYFILSVQVEALAALYGNDKSLIIDSADNVLLPSDGDHISDYSGSEMDNFIQEVL